MRNKIIMATATLLLSSCGIYSDFSTPKIEIENLAGKEVELPDSSAVAIPSWEATFTDPYLQELINRALITNSDMVISQLNINNAETMLTTSRLSYLPSFMLTPEGIMNGGGGGNSYSLPLKMSWEVDIFGKKRNSKEQAKVALEQSKEYKQMVRTQLISTLASSYYTLVMLDEQLSITNESAATLLETVNVLESLKEAGQQSDAAVRQASANYQSVLISAEQLEHHITLLENTISMILSEAPQSIERSQIDKITFAEGLHNSVSLAALSNRPDVRHSEMQLSQSFYGINYARASLYPTITLGGSAGWIGSGGNPATFVFSALGSLTQPLFMAGANRANLKIAKSKYEHSLILFTDALLLAGSEVNGALLDRETALVKQKLRVKQMEDLFSAVETTQELMNSGQVSYLEVLTAQNSLLMSRISHSADWFAYAQGDINLYKSLGGGSER